MKRYKEFKKGLSEEKRQESKKFFLKFFGEFLDTEPVFLGPIEKKREEDKSEPNKNLPKDH